MSDSARSFANVLDLLDHRYLRLAHDVAGNVEPFPNLVPYEEYTHDISVYILNKEHEKTIGKFQDFTDRSARALEKELWTWFIQWDVVPPNPSEAKESTRKSKRRRLDEDKSADPSDPSDPSRRDAGHKYRRILKMQKRVLPADLFEEDDLLRILIDIVQVESMLVPNFVEFLYKWVDFYEGDGKALQGAARGEIPSLFDFEYHPLELPRKETDTVNFRKKPDTAAIEAQAEESERLQYREPKFGLKIPKPTDPLPPLINIPQDAGKRRLYYAACFKSRQRAIGLLFEAGINMKQIQNYKKLQTLSPKETSQTHEGDGLKNYYKEVRYAEEQFMRNENSMKKREKSREILLSSKLAMEAQVAALEQAKEVGNDNQGNPELPVPPPLIPNTPAYDFGPSMNRMLKTKVKGTKRPPPDPIEEVPVSLKDKLKSKHFVGVNANYSVSQRMWKDPIPVVYEKQGSVSVSSVSTGSPRDDDDDDHSWGGGNYDSDDDGDDHGPDNAPRPILEPQPGPPPIAAPNIAPAPANFGPNGLQRLMSFLSPAARQEVANRVNNPTGLVQNPTALPPTATAAINALATGIRTRIYQNVGHGQEVQGEQRLTTAPIVLMQPQQQNPAMPTVPARSQQGVPATSSQPTVTKKRMPVLTLPTPPQQRDGALPTTLALQAQGAAPTAGITRGDSDTPMPSTSTPIPRTQLPIVPVSHPDDKPWNSGPVPGCRCRPSSFANNANPSLTQRRMGSMPTLPSPTMLPAQGIPSTAGTARSSSVGSVSTFPTPNSSRTSQSMTGSQTDSLSWGLHLPLQPIPAPSADSINPTLAYQIPTSGASQIWSNAIRVHPPTHTTPAMAVMPSGMIHRLPLEEWQSYLRSQQTQATAQARNVVLSAASGSNQNHGSRAMGAPNNVNPQQLSSTNASLRNQVPQVTSVSANLRPSGPDQVVMPAVPRWLATYRAENAERAARDASASQTFAAQARQNQGAPAPLMGPMSGQDNSAGNTNLTLRLPTGIQRNAPAPINTSNSTASPSTLTPIAQDLKMSSAGPSTTVFPLPIAPSLPGKPIMIYFPKVLRRGNSNPDTWVHSGVGNESLSDAFLLGYQYPDSRVFDLSRAILFPLHLWDSIRRQLQSKIWTLMETYPLPQIHPLGNLKRGNKAPEDMVYFPHSKKNHFEMTPHGAAYRKLSDAYKFMSVHDREKLHTKRYRVTQGPLTATKRGAVWEGWGVHVNKGIQMTPVNRKGANTVPKYVDDPEVLERRKRVDEYMKYLEEEGDGDDGDDDMDVDE
ncbi:hypothetical protein BS50DRAFT_675166 [Corynespora cassiicola Philippines]|uniref:Uncharacterized protein n=1 Tax=Corynespora cassiicola Philippines TaxID=1448308 RepID=A0A2T2NTW9_CORCC|nr:hypothetical protein BS50DRAFT_675166 [Corynespora cassiicola Philippines]